MNLEAVSLKLNPVRVYAALSALLLLVAHYVPNLPIPLILGVAAALFGVGESGVRAAVTPNEKVVVSTDDVDEGDTVLIEHNVVAQTDPTYDV